MKLVRRTLVPSARDVIDWIADREPLFVEAWTPELVGEVAWPPGAVSEMWGAMIDALLARSGFDGYQRSLAFFSSVSADIAKRFFDVTLKLAQAASNQQQELKIPAAILSHRRTTIAAGAGASDNDLAYDAIILPRDHPFWARRAPPLGMDCVAETVLMTRGQVARSGMAHTTEDDLADRESRLTASWPVSFQPLLDFRRPLVDLCG